LTHIFLVIGGDGNPGFTPVTKEENVRLSGHNGDVTDLISIPLSAKLKATLLKEQERKQRDLLKDESDGYVRGTQAIENHLLVESKGTSWYN